MVRAPCDGLSEIVLPEIIYWELIVGVQDASRDNTANRPKRQARCDCVLNVAV